MKNSLFIIALYLALGAFTKVNAQQTDLPFKFSEESYGIYSSHTAELEKLEALPNFDHKVVDKQVLVKQTDRVPAKKGLEFCVDYKLISAAKDTMHLQLEWIYPHAITDPQKKSTFKSIKYPIKLPLNETNGSTYSLDNEYEVVKGTWQFNIYYDDKIIYTRKFELY